MWAVIRLRSSVVAITSSGLCSVQNINSDETSGFATKALDQHFVFSDLKYIENNCVS